MKIEPVFAVGIGHTKDVGSLSIARKIFAENKDALIPSKTTKNFRTSLEKYYPEKAASKEFTNLEDTDKLRQSIKENAKKYLYMCGYDTAVFDLKVPNIWLNEMKSGSFHKQHIHYGSNLSGCYYVDIPTKCGAIMFKNPQPVNSCSSAEILNYTPFNSPNWSFSPEEGDMFFWSSTLVHEVPLADFKGVRRSIAFDVLITPKR